MNKFHENLRSPIPPPPANLFAQEPTSFNFDPNSSHRPSTTITTSTGTTIATNTTTYSKTEDGLSSNTDPANDRQEIVSTPPPSHIQPETFCWCDGLITPKSRNKTEEQADDRQEIAAALPLIIPNGCWGCIGQHQRSPFWWQTRRRN